MVGSGASSNASLPNQEASSEEDDVTSSSDDDYDDGTVTLSAIRRGSVSMSDVDVLFIQVSFQSCTLMHPPTYSYH
jgi:hypothetical protein